MKLEKSFGTAAKERKEHIGKNLILIFRFFAVFGGMPDVVGFMLLVNPKGIESFSPGLRLAAPACPAEALAKVEAQRRRAGATLGGRKKFINPERG
jgi:hypothetical protein